MSWKKVSCHDGVRGWTATAVGVVPLPRERASDVGPRQVGALVQGPVIVSGLGGSGTRVVASICVGAGFYFGSDLNRALDNLWFTLLFKRPRWLPSAITREDARRIHDALGLFHAAMQGDRKTVHRQAGLTIPAFLEAATYPHLRRRARVPAWAARRLHTLLMASPPPDGNVGWGWKEPNTHIVLEHLAAHFPEARYIHIVRSGLDMAFSNNMQQTRNWSALYDIEPSGTGRPSPQAMLEYWIRANTAAVERADRLFGARFLLLSFEALVADPIPVVAGVLDFLGRAEIESGAHAASIFTPRTIGRHHGADLSRFTTSQLRLEREISAQAAERTQRLA